MKRNAVFVFAVLALTPGCLLPDGCDLQAQTSTACGSDSPVADSPYIPVDSWIYPAVLRLYSLGFVDHVFVGMRPWTRANLSLILEEAEEHFSSAGGGAATDEAEGIVDALRREVETNCAPSNHFHAESIYSVARAISGTPLADSFHLGQTVVNDYGRPYENGFNNFTGASGYAIAGRFQIYARAEFQHAPAAAGYSAALAQTLSSIDRVTYLNSATDGPYRQATIPQGPINSKADVRILEAYVSTHVLHHEVSFGRQDNWLGPGVGGGMAYSNNAENVYSFRVNRVDPWHVPGLSRYTGPFRYDFLIGPLKGHTAPNAPWMHAEKISFRPTRNLEFGFERTIVWGGEGHQPVTLHTFLKGFFSLSSPTDGSKGTRNDPGARFTAFDFSYRLPFARRWLTLYTDSEAHDDVSPISAPNRGAWRPGLYLSHLPRASKLDLRVEGVTTDPPSSRSVGGVFNYWEAVQKQAYTNQGQIFGDWMGREAKGGQAWLTYHLSGNEWIQGSWRHQKAAKDFIPGGTTINDARLQVMKRVGRDFEINGNFTLERWKAPVYLQGSQTVSVTSIQLTWFPEHKIRF
jgi:hypothetical protein